MSEKVTGSLKERAILVRLERENCWLGKRTDQSMKAEIEKRKGTSDHVEVKRNLFPGCDQPLDQVFNAINHVDYVYRRRTLPWLPGVNIIASPLFLQFTQAMNDAFTQLDRAKAELRNNWPDMVRQGIQNSKGTAHISEYPSIDDLDEMYQLHLTYYPVHDSSDWRVTLPHEVVEDIKQRLEDDNERRLATATNEIWHRLAKEIEAAWKNLNGAKLRPEWIERLRELAQSIPDLNLANDPDLEDAAKRAEALTQDDIDTLKSDQQKKDSVRDKAEDLYNQLKEYI